MPLDEPSWWYTQDGSLTAGAHALMPAAWLYARISAARMAGSPRYVPRLPVICIGNFTAGGTGKTPLTQRIARVLIAAGRAPAVLTRGYGGSERGPRFVDSSRDDASAVGDEPLLLAATVPVCIARDRIAGARFIEAEGMADVILMDDGLQNPALAKDLSLAVVDAARVVGNGLTIPAGPLRAPLDVQLPKVAALVINHGSDMSSASPLRGPRLDALVKTFHGPVFDAAIAPSQAVDDLAGVRVVAYAGIANPERFFKLLQSCGADIRATVSFQDHHTFSGKDAAELIGLARSHDAKLVTTEKDFVRLPAKSGAPDVVSLKAASTLLVVEMVFAENHAASLQRLLLDAIDLADKRKSASSHGVRAG